MASCPACGATIQHATTRDGVHVPLEVFTEPQGSERYRVVASPSVAEGLVVDRVTDDAPIDAYPDHRKDCPDHGNGLSR